MREGVLGGNDTAPAHMYLNVQRRRITVPFRSSVCAAADVNTYAGSHRVLRLSQTVVLTRR